MRKKPLQKVPIQALQMIKSGLLVRGSMDGWIFRVRSGKQQFYHPKKEF